MERRDIKIDLMITDELPDTVGGITGDLGDGSFIMAINGNRSEDEQARAFLHECLHIWHKDFNREAEDVPQLERERREELRRLLAIST